MSKYRIRTVLGAKGTIEYQIQERLLFFFWDDIYCSYEKLEMARSIMQSRIDRELLEKLRKSFKSEIVEGK